MSEETQSTATTAPATALEQLQANIRRMLTMHCGDPVPCQKCGRPMWYVRMAKSGKLNPFCDDAVSHFATCKYAEHFRKGK